MKTTMTAAVVVVLAGVLGCSARGGSAADEQGFRIGLPVFDTQLRQGQTESIKVSLYRGDEFKRDVRVTVTTPEGLTVKPTETVVKAGDERHVFIQVTAPKDAALGTYRITFTGTPDTGAATSVAHKVKVVAP